MSSLREARRREFALADHFGLPELLLLWGHLKFLFRSSSHLGQSNDVTKCKFMCPVPTTLKCQSLEQRKVYGRAMQGDRWFMPPQTLNSRKGLSKAFLKARRGEECGCLWQTSWCRNPLFLMFL